MRKTLLISVFLVLLHFNVRSQTWLGVSHTTGLKSVQLDYFDPNASIDANGFLIEHQFSKRFGAGFGLSWLSYQYDLSNVYYSFSRFPISCIYYGRFLNIKPTLYLDIFHRTNAFVPYYEIDSDMQYSSLGFGVSFGKNLNLSKKLVLEPEITYLSTSLEYFYPELTFGLTLKYRLK